MYAFRRWKLNSNPHSQHTHPTKIQQISSIARFKKYRNKHETEIIPRCNKRAATKVRSVCMQGMAVPMTCQPSMGYRPSIEFCIAVCSQTESRYFWLRVCHPTIVQNWAQIWELTQNLSTNLGVKHQSHKTEHKFGSQPAQLHKTEHKFGSQPPLHKTEHKFGSRPPVQIQNWAQIWEEIRFGIFWEFSEIPTKFYKILPAFCMQ